MHEMRQAQALLMHRQQGVKIRQQARLQTYMVQRRLGQRAQQLRHQFAVKMHPVQGPGPPAVRPIAVGQLLGQQQQIAAAHSQALITQLHPATARAAINQQVIVRRGALHLMAVGLGIKTHGQRIAALGQRMTGQYPPQPRRGNKAQTHSRQRPTGRLDQLIHKAFTTAH